VQYWPFSLLWSCPKPWRVTYYVKADGDDARDGLTDATAWRTLDQVNAAVNETGADVMLKSGSTFHDQTLTIDWPGTESDRVVVGCYYLDPANNNRETSCDQGSRAGNVELPEINGTLEASCRSAANCRYNSDGAVPRSHHDGLVRISRSHVTVQDLKVRDSAGRGLTADGRTNSADSGSISDLTLQRLDIMHTAFSPVVLEHNIRFAIVRDSQIRYYNWCERNHREDAVAACRQGGPWPGGVALVRSKPSYSLIENNTIYGGAGEGINCLFCSHVIIRGNRVGNTHSSTVYVDHGNHTIIENNVIWGNPANGNAFYRGGVSFEGIALAMEDYGYMGARAGAGSDNLIRNNLIVGHRDCIKSGAMPRSAEAGHRIGARIYGNTCAGQTGDAVIRMNQSAANTGSWDVRNNIFYSPGVRNMCQTPSSGSIVFDNNLWSERPSSSVCRGAGDVHGDPGFPVSLADLTNADWSRVPTAASLTVAAGSIATTSAADLSGLRTLNRSDWRGIDNAMRPLAHIGCDSTFHENALPVDYRCRRRSAGNGAMGAVSTGAGAVAPAAPTIM
jgi:hypothetical protein